jgi:hypothetical protein
MPRNMKGQSLRIVASAAGNDNAARTGVRVTPCIGVVLGRRVSIEVGGI